jgi:hypothetical protein
MLKAIMDFYHHTQIALEAKIPLERVTALPVVYDIARMKEIGVDIAEKEIQAIMDRVQFSFADLGVT